MHAGAIYDAHAATRFDDAWLATTSWPKLQKRASFKAMATPYHPSSWKCAMAGQRPNKNNQRQKQGISRRGRGFTLIDRQLRSTRWPSLPRGWCPHLCGVPGRGPPEGASSFSTSLGLFAVLPAMHSVLPDYGIRYLLAQASWIFRSLGCPEITFFI